MRRGLLLVAMITAVRAFAHVAPSVDDNNRYLKITPQADRVRLAYTVFFGEVPGAALRPGIDTNHDGAITDEEARVSGDRLAAEVIAALDLSLDGKQLRVAWKQVTVGMGSPVVNAGSYSIDMIAYVCLAQPRGPHRLLLRDRYRLSNPGETEVLVEDGHGISIQHMRLGAAPPVDNIVKLAGGGGPLSDDGLDVAFTADDSAPLSGECTAAAAVDTDRVPWLAIGIAGGAVLLLGAALVIRHSRRT